LPLSPSGIIWYQPTGGDALCIAGKVTVGLASHWPCITDNSGITTYGLTALGREMSTPPIPSGSVAHFSARWPSFVICWWSRFVCGRLQCYFSSVYSHRFFTSFLKSWFRFFSPFDTVSWATGRVWTTILF